jgi:histidine triad (HIT) family protein
MPSDCLFCRIVAGELPSTQVYADDDVVGIRDIAPQAPTHVLLVTRKHIPSVRGIGLDDADLMEKLRAAAVKLAEQEGIAQDGFRMVINTGRNGGQTVDHLHVHVLGGRPMQWPPG